MANEIDTSKLRLGPCYLKYDGSQIGATKGGVVINGTMETKDIKVDQLGETIVKKIVMGFNLSIEAPLAEIDATKFGLFPNFDNNIFYDGTGMDLLSSAKQFVLTPLDGTEIWTITKCIVVPNFKINYNDDTRVLNVTFNAMPDTSQNKTAYGYPIATLSAQA